MNLLIEQILIDLVALANGVTALIVIYFMQRVTGDAGFRCPLALLQLVQRVSYVALAYALMANGVHIYTVQSLPGFHSGFVQLTLFSCCIVSFMRHRYAPPIPRDVSWRRPAAPHR